MDGWWMEWPVGENERPRSLEERGGNGWWMEGPKPIFKRARGVNGWWIEGLVGENNISALLKSVAGWMDDRLEPAAMLIEGGGG